MIILVELKTFVYSAGTKSASLEDKFLCYVFPSFIIKWIKAANGSSLV